MEDSSFTSKVDSSNWSKYSKMSSEKSTLESVVDKLTEAIHKLAPMKDQFEEMDEIQTVKEILQMKVRKYNTLLKMMEKKGDKDEQRSQ